MRSTTWLRLVAVTMVIALVAAGCGDDDDGDDASDTTEQSDGSTTTEGGDAGPVEVTLTAEGVEGMPEEVGGGLVTMSVTNDADLPASLDLIKGADDASEDEVAQALQVAQEGGEIGEALDNFVGSPGVDPGATVEVSLTLTPGSWYAQALLEIEEGEEGEDAEEGSADTTTSTSADGASPDSAPDSTDAPGSTDDGSSPPAPSLVPFTVTDGDDATLPDEGSTISAVDYSFEVSIDPESDELAFTNDSSEQFHHAVFLPMAEGVDEDQARAAVEQLLTSAEDAPPPPEFDFETDLGGDTNVTGPGLGVVQPQGDFESGRTYAVLCFIPDRTGGPPHAIAQNMWDVFTLG